MANVEIVETSFMGHSNNCPSKADDVQLEGTATIIPNFHSEIEEKEDDDVFLEPGRVVEGPAEVSGKSIRIPLLGNPITFNTHVIFYLPIYPGVHLQP